MRNEKQNKSKQLLGSNVGPRMVRGVKEQFILMSFIMSFCPTT